MLSRSSPFIFADMYGVIRSILFLLPPETAHHFSMFCLKIICSIPFFRKTLKRYFTPKNCQPHSAFRISFRNRIGLGAGFDKNATYLRELETLGFGFVEIGTVTPLPQKGNSKPRLFRLPKDEALINRMGFNNDGVELIAERLKNWRNKEGRKVLTNGSHRSIINHQSSSFIIGGNIGKNKNTPNYEAWKDYEICFTALHPYVDFFVVNVSSPNTPGLRELQEKDSLKKILTHLQKINSEYEFKKPILLKIAPDLTWSQIDDVIDLAKEISLDGLVATNTTISRSLLQTSLSRVESIGVGGLSGKPLKQRSTEIIKYISTKTSGTLPIIGSGGISTASDAREKFEAGALLAEVWSGFIYAGPMIVKKIYKGLDA